MSDDQKKITEKYDSFKEKYSLPSLKDIDREFELGSFEVTEFILREIAKKMAEKIHNCIKILSEILQPENGMLSMIESESFSEEERSVILELIKKLAYLDRSILIEEFDYEEKRCAELVKKVYEDYLSLKPEFMKILEKLKGSWNGSFNQKLSDIEKGYFG
jgi:hypothetical protein